LGKAEDKRAAIVAQQAARELAERNAKPTSTNVAARKKRPNWAATSAISPRRGRPPRSEES
jgi:hypothetical protein